MFSRFDNMMQHTQTHNKARSTSRGPKNGSTGKSKDKRSSEASLSDDDSCYDQSGLPSPPPSRRGTKNKDFYKARIRQQRQLQRKNYAEDYEEEDRDDDDDDDDDDDEDDDDDNDMNCLGYGDSDESDSDASYSMYGYHHNSAIADQREMFAEMRRSSHDGYTLPLPVPYSQQHPSLPWPALPKSVLNHDPIWSLPSIHAPIPLIPSGSRTSATQRPHRRHRLSESPLSFSSGSTTDASPCKRQRTTPKVQFHPYPYDGNSHRRHSTDNGQKLRPLYHEKKSGDRNTPIDEDEDRHMILPRIATYLVAHPDEPPENYLLHHHQQQRSPLYQKRAMTWPTLPGTEKVITRRLSVQDLCNPIEYLEHFDGNNVALPTPVKQEEEEGVDLTLDEYEAIQGFGRFQKCGLLGLE
jgi:hypothetical protein